MEMLMYAKLRKGIIMTTQEKLKSDSQRYKINSSRRACGQMLATCHGGLMEKTKKQKNRKDRREAKKNLREYF